MLYLLLFIEEIRDVLVGYINDVQPLSDEIYSALACEEGILSILIQRNWRRKSVAID